jgi:TolB-like protein/class 3 adenylate cyclase
VERRLAAVLAADVVGYTKLMTLDEAGTVLRFQSRMNDVYAPCVSGFKGRVIKTMGDGFLAEFSSALDAVSCAIELQELNATENAHLGVGDIMQLRIGVSVADVMIADGDIFGTGVNLAARLQSIAEPEGISITAATMEQVRGKMKREIRRRGPQKLHNFPEEVLVYDLVHPGSAPRDFPETSLPLDCPSIAVLPLDPLHSDDTERYFSDGFTEDIITELSRFRSIRVIARNSSFRYRGGSADIPQVRRDLKVNFVLEGSLQKQADTYRITLQLIDAETQLHVWADKYDVSAQDILSARDEITRSIVSRVTYQVDNSLLREMRRQKPKELKAYDLYLRGADHHQTGGVEGFAAAKQFYGDAIAIDPMFSKPHAGLAEILFFESLLNNWGSPSISTAEALRYARRAVGLDEADAHGHAILAFIWLYCKQFLRAERCFARAVELNPNDADIAILRASQLAHMGKPKEGLAQAQRAFASNPFHPDWYEAELSIIHCLAGNYAESLQHSDVNDWSLPHSPAWRAISSALLGDEQAARLAGQQFVERVSPIWKGDSAAGPEDYARWFLEFVPLTSPDDRHRLANGLRIAGLPT